MYDTREVRDIYREAAARKFQVSEDSVDEGMIKAVKDIEFDDYSIEEEPLSGWDEYYYNICKQIARNSKCLSRKIKSWFILEILVIRVLSIFRDPFEQH